MSYLEGGLPFELVDAARQVSAALRRDADGLLNDEGYISDAISLRAYGTMHRGALALDLLIETDHNRVGISALREIAS